MAGNLTFDELKRRSRPAPSTPCVAAFADMQGRLIGKRFQAEYFVESAYDETHGCNYLLPTTSTWSRCRATRRRAGSKGYGDFVMKPDLSTMRACRGCREDRAGALRRAGPPPSRGRAALAARHPEGAGDAARRPGHDGLLRLRAGILPVRRDLRDAPAQELLRASKTASPYIEDYHIFQTTKEEGVMRAIRNGLAGAGIPVENSKGEWGPGQEEINVRYAEALDDGRPARHHEERQQGDRLASGQGRSPSWRSGTTASPAIPATSTSRCGTADGKTPLFFDKGGEHGMSTTDAALRRPGQLELCARDHLLPRALHQLLQALPGRHLRADRGGLERRQPHRRLPPVRRGHQGHPHRVPHRRRRPQSLSRLRRADCARASTASRRSWSSSRPSRATPTSGKRLREIPKTLREATDLLDRSKMLRTAFGDEVIDHYVAHRATGSSSNMTAASPTGN